jgi:glycosyltransferase involved in cell wall biosynthesis
MCEYIFFTNIPAPYRTAFYNSLYEKMGNFEVLYMREREDDRSWTIDRSAMKHPFTIDVGFYRMLGRFHIHVNPKLIWKIVKSRESKIIIGGSWNDLNVLFLVTLRRLGLIRNVFHFWSEANYLTIGAANDNWFKFQLRKYVYHSSSGAQLSSGRMTELTFEKWGIDVSRYVHLPNTIEESAFSISDDDVARRRGADLPVYLMPVRLLESVKGIMNFFSCIGRDNILSGVFVIAGDGPDRSAIERYIVDKDLTRNVRLVGYCDLNSMTTWYKRANVFVLPSYSDPSPLSVIEALRMRLPLLISERCGNHFEALVPGENGYLFDPYDCKSVRHAFESMKARSAEWGLMGDLSGSRYQEQFAIDEVIKRFVLQLKEP